MKPIIFAVLSLLLLFSLNADGQLTQTLGWGSAGSPGKRSSLSTFCKETFDRIQYLTTAFQVLKKNKLTNNF